MAPERVSFTVNGAAHSLEIEPMARLLDVLREDLHLTGTKEGCGEGECGACAVLISSDSNLSSTLPASTARG